MVHQIMNVEIYLFDEIFHEILMLIQLINVYFQYLMMILNFYFYQDHYFPIYKIKNKKNKVIFVLNICFFFTSSSSDLSFS